MNGSPPLLVSGRPDARRTRLALLAAFCIRVYRTTRPPETMSAHSPPAMTAMTSRGRQIVPGSVVQASGSLELRGGDQVEFVECESCQLAANVRTIRPNALGVEGVPLHDVGGLPSELDPDGAVFNRVRQVTDSGHDLRCPSGEQARLVRISLGANHERGVPRVTGVEDAAKPVIHLREGVGLVDQERRLPGFDSAEERSGRDVPAQQRGAADLAEHHDGARLATPLRR